MTAKSSQRLDISDTLVVLGDISKSGSGTSTQSDTKSLDLTGQRVSYGYVTESHAGYSHGDGAAGASIIVYFADSTHTTLTSVSGSGNTPKSSSEKGYITAAQEAKGIVSATLTAYGGGTMGWDKGGGYVTGSAMLYGYRSEWIDE